MSDVGRTLTNLTTPLALIKSKLLGEELLTQVKARMITENVWKAIFGNAGERIFIAELPSLNDKIMPLIEFSWSRERFDNFDAYRTGIIDARIILPAQLKGDFNRFRKISAAWMRWIGASQHKLFTYVSGLTMFGTGTEFDYTKMVEASGVLYPVITMRIPFQFDERLFENQNEDIDTQGALDADLVGDLESYSIEVVSEEGTVLIAETVLSTTDSE